MGKMSEETRVLKEPGEHAGNEDEGSCEECGAILGDWSQDTQDQQQPGMDEETVVLKEPGEMPDFGYADEGCEGCDAPPGVPCDPECPVSGAEHPQHEATAFDKFMPGIRLNESRNVVKREELDESAAKRGLAQNYQERPLGKIRYGVKR